MYRLDWYLYMDLLTSAQEILIRGNANEDTL